MLAFLDYDGTLTTHEANEIVLQRFVGDAWRPLGDFNSVLAEVDAWLERR